MKKLGCAAAKKVFFSIIKMLPFFIFYSALAAPVNQPLQNLIDRYTESGRLPGVVLGVFIDDLAPFYLTSGVSNIQTKEPMHADALFRFGSTIKTITAIILLNKLKTENISIHTSIEDIIKNHPNRFANELSELSNDYAFLKQITLLQLLNHTSHLVNEQSTANYLETFSRDKDSYTKLMSHLRRSAARGQGQHQFQYANVNYILLGKIIETLYNKPFAEVIQAEVFNTLNLKNTHYYYSQTDINQWCPLQAHAYEPANLGSVAVFRDRPIIENYQRSQLDYIDLTCAYDPSWDDGPAGALLASPIDMGHLAKQIFSKNTSFANAYWDYINTLPSDPNAKANVGNLEMNYKLGIWQGHLGNGLLFWRLIGEQWGFSGGAIFVPKQKAMHHALLLIYAINTDQPKFLEGNELDQGLVEHALHIIEKN